MTVVQRHRLHQEDALIQTTAVDARARFASDFETDQGLLRKRRRPRRWTHPGAAPVHTDAPNQVWPADFKGQFRDAGRTVLLSVDRDRSLQPRLAGLVAACRPYGRRTPSRCFARCSADRPARRDPHSSVEPLGQHPNLSAEGGGVCRSVESGPHGRQELNARTRKSGRVWTGETTPCARGGVSCCCTDQPTQTFSPSYVRNLAGASS